MFVSKVHFKVDPIKYDQDGHKISTCYLCKFESKTSLNYNIMIGYETVHLCSLECQTIVNSYYRTISHYKDFHWSNLEKSVRYYCYSSRCKTSSHNLNVSLILRGVEYYTKVKLGMEPADHCIKHMQYLLSEDQSGDEWSHEDPYDSEFEAEFGFLP